MPERVDDGHQWIGAATVPLSPTVVRQAAKRGLHRVKRETKIAVLEVYCANCRGNYDRVAGRPCAAKDKNAKDHLTGGTVGDTRKRAATPPPPVDQIATSTRRAV